MRKPLKILLVTSALMLVLGLAWSSCSPGGSSGGRASVGSPAPGFELDNLSAESVSLSDFEGRPVMINFWRVDCPPCRAEIPHLQDAYEEYQDNDLMMLMINVSENPSEVKTFLDNNGITFPVLFDTDAEVAVSYGIPGVPTTFFIDREGIIKAKVIGPLLSSDAIDSRLSEIIN